MTEKVRASAGGNARWTALAQAVRVGYQLVGLLLLSRLLEPDAFGLVAMATVVANFANLIRDLGTAAAIIQRKSLNQEAVSTAFWFSVATGLFIAVIVSAGSPLLARFFQRSELTLLLLLLALSFPLASLGSVHQALLERDSQFPVIARIEIISGGVGLAAAVGSALAGAGAYSLVGQTVVVAGLSTVQLWLASPWRPRGLEWNQVEFRALWGFSGSLAGFNIINYFSRNADAIIIGRVLGTSALGAYSLAYRLMLFPVQSLSHVATRALFPIFSQQQDSPNELGKLYLQTLGAIASVSVPCMAGAYALREQFVSVALGNEWALVADILVWLAPVGLVQSLTSTTGTVFMALGRTDLLLRVGSLTAVVYVGSFMAGLNWGVIGVSIAYLIANLLLAPVSLRFALALTGFGLLDLLKVLWPSILSGLVMVVVLRVGTHFGRSRFDFSLISLGVLVVLGCLVYVAAMRLFDPGAFGSARKLVRYRTKPRAADSDH